MTNQKMTNIDLFTSSQKDEFMTSGLMESRQKQGLTHSAKRDVAEDDDDEEHTAQHIRAAPATKKRGVRETKGRSSSHTYNPSGTPETESSKVTWWFSGRLCKRRTEHHNNIIPIASI